jgi:hypothetical protein
MVLHLSQLKLKLTGGIYFTQTLRVVGGTEVLSVVLRFPLG